SRRTRNRGTPSDEGWEGCPTLHRAARRSRRSRTCGRLLRRFHEGAVELDGDAAPKELDGHDDETPLVIPSHHDPLDAGERAALAAHTLPFPVKRIRENRKL